MEKNFNIVFVSMEMSIPEFPEPVRGANFKGGLGILAGDIMNGLKKSDIKVIGIVPFYNHHWGTREVISYDKIGQLVLELRPQINEKRYTIKVWKINRGGCDVYGLECPNVFDVIYTEDRWQRLLQEVLIGKTVGVLLKKLDIKPDILWLNESHTVISIPTLKEDSYFEKTKFLFTIHTPDPAGMEKFYEGWFNELGIDRKKYYSIFVKDGLIDFCRAAMILSDKVNSVSQEHCQVTKEIFPEWKDKIIGIRNGSSRDIWLSPRIKVIEQNISPLSLWEASQEDKNAFLELVRQKSGTCLNPRKPVMGWIRRIVQYKNQYPMLEPIIKAICAERGEIIDTLFGRLPGLGIQMVGAGQAAETDGQCLYWINEFRRWTKEVCGGNFVFLPEYDFELLQKGAAGCDIWLSSPWPRHEACGTSDQRATINGSVNVATKTGGAMEYIKEGFNGFFIEPYEPKTVYDKLKIISDLYYNWIEKGDESWLKLRWNVYHTGKVLDIVETIKEYEEKIFAPLLSK